MGGLNSTSDPKSKHKLIIGTDSGTDRAERMCCLLVWVHSMCHVPVASSDNGSDLQLN